MGKPVRVSIPASVAGDLGHFQKAVGSILDQLGCQACCSGHDIEFELQRSMAFADDFSMHSNVMASRVAKKTPLAVAASINPELASDIGRVNNAIERIAGSLGCPACCSGHDLRITLERSFVMGDDLKVREQAIAIGL